MASEPLYVIGISSINNAMQPTPRWQPERGAAASTLNAAKCEEAERGRAFFSSLSTAQPYGGRESSVVCKSKRIAGNHIISATYNINKANHHIIVMSSNISKAR